MSGKRERTEVAQLATLDESIEPRFSEHQWRSLSEEQREDFVENIFRYYRRHGYPHYVYSPEERIAEFESLRRFDVSKIIDNGTVRQTMHGLGLAWSYFPHATSIRVGAMKTPEEVYEDDDLFRAAIRRRLKRGTYLSHSGMRKAIRTFSGVQAVSNFRPTAARAIYEAFAPQDATVWDMSCGFGGRLLGAYSSSNVKRYIGTDPSTPTMNGLREMRDDFSELAGVKTELHKVGSEEIRFPRGSVDLCFTSPPYFNTERYTDESTQSWVRYASQDEWNELFMRPTLEACYSCLKKDGWLVLNVADVKTHRTLVDDATTIAMESGFRLMGELKLSLSSITAGGYKYEPVLLFRPL